MLRESTLQLLLIVARSLSHLLSLSTHDNNVYYQTTARCHRLSLSREMEAFESVGGALPVTALLDDGRCLLAGTNDERYGTSTAWIVDRDAGVAGIGGSVHVYVTATATAAPTSNGSLLGEPFEAARLDGILRHGARVHGIRRVPHTDSMDPSQDHGAIGADAWRRVVVFGGKQVVLLRYRVLESHGSERECSSSMPSHDTHTTSSHKVEIEMLWRLPERRDWVWDVLVIDARSHVFDLEPTTMTESTVGRYENELEHRHADIDPTTTGSHTDDLALMIGTAHNLVELWLYPQQLAHPYRSIACEENGILYGIPHRSITRRPHSPEMLHCPCISAIVAVPVDTLWL